MFPEVDHQQPLILYGTVGCHLCELAAQQLLVWVEQGWQVELVDIADDDELYERFSLLIPVLEYVPGKRLLHWPFDQDALRHFLLKSGTR